MEVKIKLRPEDSNILPGHYTLRADSFVLVDGHMVVTDYKLTRNENPNERQLEAFQSMFGFAPRP